MDNVFSERLWRSLKYEDIYHKGYADGREARTGMGLRMALCNGHRRTRRFDSHEGMQGPIYLQESQRGRVLYPNIMMTPGW